MKRVLLPLLMIAALLLSACTGAAKGTIKIGLQGPMTGDYAEEGKGFDSALKLLVEQTNKAGGINGQQVELTVEDDKGDPKESALVADRLVSKKVMAVIGGYNSSATEPASKIYSDAGILHITPSSTATRLTTKGYTQFFRVCFLDDRQGLFAAEFITKVLSFKNVAVLHDNSTYAQGLAEWTKKYLEERGVKVVFFDAINPKDNDFTPTLTKIKGVNPEAIYFTGYYAQGGLLLKQAPGVGLKTQWLMGNACNNPDLIKIAGVENTKGVIVTSEPLPNDLDYPEAKKFNADFKTKYGKEPSSVWTVMAADAFRVIKQAVEATKSTDPKKLAEYLHKDFKDYPGITGPIIGFDEKGDRKGTIHKAYVINDKGEFVPNPKQP
jgi:branched-chain amino acid transport system substrate-binding protein